MSEESASKRNNYLSLGKGAAFVVGAVLGLGLVGWAAGWWSFDLDRATVETWVARAGPLGPLAVVFLMTVAVVASPIPSAPVALASGAAYGHYAGTLYVALGSEIGALVALARGAARGEWSRWEWVTRMCVISCPGPTASRIA